MLLGAISFPVLCSQTLPVLILHLASKGAIHCCFHTRLCINLLGRWNRHILSIQTENYLRPLHAFSPVFKPLSCINLHSSPLFFLLPFSFSVVSCSSLWSFSYASQTTIQCSFLLKFSERWQCKKNLKYPHFKKVAVPSDRSSGHRTFSSATFVRPKHLDQRFPCSCEFKYP